MRGSIVPFVSLLCLLLAACTISPAKLGGSFASVTPHQASTAAFTGQEVRWGGVVTGMRMTDQGECVEVGWYRVDPFTLRPELGAFYSGYVYGGAYGHSGDDKPVYPTVTLGAMRTVAAPRFLACGDAVRDRSTYFIGAVITLTGTVESPDAYQVKYTDCIRSTRSYKAAYSGTIHTTDGEVCVVSLPVLEVKVVQVWKEPPLFDRTFNHN